LLVLATVLSWWFFKKIVATNLIFFISWFLFY